MCFCVLSRSSFNNVKNKWYKEIKSQCDPSTPFLIVGTKADVMEDRGVLKQLAAKGSVPVTKEEGQALAEDLGAVGYVECSAKTQVGMKKVFESAVCAVLSKRDRIRAHAYDCCVTM